MTNLKPEDQLDYEAIKTGATKILAFTEGKTLLTPQEAVERELARVCLSLLADRARMEKALENAEAATKACGGIEQPAFEAWAASERFSMEEHPLHYIFMNERTDAARAGWKAGIAFARQALGASLDGK